MNMTIPIVVTLVGIEIDVSDVHNSKAPNSMIVTLVGIMILVKRHHGYRYLVMLVVPAGIVTDVETDIVYRFIPVTV